MREYDDYPPPRSGNNVALVSLIMIVLVIIGILVYLIFFPEENVKDSDETTDAIDYLGIINEEPIGTESVEEEPAIDYRQLYFDSEMQRSELQKKSLEQIQKVIEYNKQRDEKELEDLRTIQKLTEERDMYKEAYEQVEAYMNALMDELKAL